MRYPLLLPWPHAVDIEARALLDVVKYQVDTVPFVTYEDSTAASTSALAFTLHLA